MGKKPMEEQKIAAVEEDSAANAKEQTEKLRSRLKEAMAQRGGPEAFLHWLRSNDENSL